MISKEPIGVLVRRESKMKRLLILAVLAIALIGMAGAANYM